MTEVTQLLLQIEQGDSLAADQLLPPVDGDSRRLAAETVPKSPPGQTDSRCDRLGA